MARISVAGACITLCTVLLTASVAHPVTPADKCEAAKLKIAGKYDLCRLLAEAKAAKTGGMPDFSTCDSAYSTRWTQAEMKAGGMCPSNGDAAAIQAFLSQGTTALGVALAGAMLPTCGNGVIDPGEQCDQSNLNGQTCASLGFAAGVLKCGAGCVFDTSGCSASRFVDNGDGTLSDLQMGLMWEKKVSVDQCVNLVDGLPVACTTDADCTGNGGGGMCVCSSVHCVADRYTWCNGTYPSPCTNGADPLDGTAYTDFLVTLNNGASTDGRAMTPITGCFAGHCDWRLPSIVELQGIVDLTQGTCGGGSGACIDPTFGPTQADLYWSATTTAGGPAGAWQVDFGDGGVTSFPKTIDFYVRAVRTAP
jgi:hypothetical protein